MAQSQEELIDLFTKSLSLKAVNPVTPNQQFSFPSDRSKPTTFASTHYNPPTFSTIQVPGSDTSVEFTLRQNDIEPSHLFPCQIGLFRNADPDQRLRLLELWRTAPFRAGDKEVVRYQYGELVSTNLLQEEVMARLRMERRLAEQNCVAQGRPDDAEPYMRNGYTSTALLPDPVPGKKASLWTNTRASYEQIMEDQYGAVMAARDFERLQDLHRQVDRSLLASDDESMVL